MSIISAVELFCCDKFEETQNEKVVNMSKLTKSYFNEILKYLQASNDEFTMMKRLLRYLIPVLSMSIMLNASKFFEAYLYYDGKEYSIRLSSFRRNLTYSAIVNWVRFLMMGIIPLSVIIYLYVKIYKDIKERQRRIFQRNCTNQINSSIPSQNVSSQHIYSFMSL